jgi:hypothetical protein
MEKYMEPCTETVEITGVKQETARVVSKDGLLHIVSSPSGVFQVKRAVSCLVEPLPEDIVLISIGENSAGYILAILEREVTGVTTVLFNGDADIQCSQGRLGISSSESVDVSCSKTISLTSTELQCTAVISAVSIDQLSINGSVAEFCIDTIKTVASHIESFTKRLFSRSEQSYKIVSELDMVKSGSIDYNAEKTLQLRGTFTQMTAKDDVHIDGERINIG